MKSRVLLDPVKFEILTILAKPAQISKSRRPTKNHANFLNAPKAFKIW